MTHPIFESDFDCLTENIMGEYSDELDRYLEAYEEKTGKTLRVPEQLIQRKLINQSIESAEHERKISYEPVLDKSHSPLVRVRSLKSVKSPSTDSYDHLVQTAMKSGPLLTPPPYVPEFGDNEITESIDNFDLERIDDRLRTFGFVFDLIDLSVV